MRREFVLAGVVLTGALVAAGATIVAQQAPAPAGAQAPGGQGRGAGPHPRPPAHGGPAVSAPWPPLPDSPLPGSRWC